MTGLSMPSLQPEVTERTGQHICSPERTPRKLPLYSRHNIREVWIVDFERPCTVDLTGLLETSRRVPQN